MHLKTENSMNSNNGILFMTKRCLRLGLVVVYEGIICGIQSSLSKQITQWFFIIVRRHCQKQARWLEFQAESDMAFELKPGWLNAPDALSRKVVEGHVASP